MKTEKETKFIVVDSDDKPMSFDGQQFCYVPTDRRYKFFLETYTEKEAKKNIEKSKQFRHRNHLSYEIYQLMQLK